MWSRRIGDPRGSQRDRGTWATPGRPALRGVVAGLAGASARARSSLWVGGRSGTAGRSGRASGTERFLTLPRPPRARVVGDASEQLTTDERGEARGRSAMWRRISAEIPRIAGAAVRMARKDQLRMARSGDPPMARPRAPDRRRVARTGGWCNGCDRCAGWCAGGAPGVRPGSAPAAPRPETGAPGPADGGPERVRAGSLIPWYPVDRWDQTPRTGRTDDPQGSVRSTALPRRDGEPRASHHVTFDTRPTGAPSWHSPIPARHRTAAP